MRSEGEGALPRFGARRKGPLIGAMLRIAFLREGRRRKAAFAFSPHVGTASTPSPPTALQRKAREKSRAQFLKPTV
jgi:hypothetical protein